MNHGPLLGTLKNGSLVYDRSDSHLHTEYPDIHTVLKTALADIEPNTNLDVATYSHIFPDVIGESIRVPTTSEDEIIFAQRLRRAGLTWFVKNRLLRPTNVFTVVVKRDKYAAGEQYILITAYVGEPAPPEPWDTIATPESIPFWNQNALVWESVPIIPGTETSERPW